MPRPTIYYIRHGETEWNALGRLQGTQDIPLNALGRVQAVQAGNILSQLVARNGHDAMRLPYVASPLSRARATMELVRETLQLPVEDYALDARLREIGYGKWEGATLPEMQAADPVFYAKRLTEKWTLAPEGGETYADVERRVRDWYDQLTGDIVAVAHGGTARALMVGFSEVEAAGECVARIIGAGIIPGGMEMMDKPAIHAAEAFVHAGYPLDVEALLIIELDGPGVEVDELIGRVEAIANGCGSTTCRISTSEAERNLFWAGRKAAFPAVGRISPDYLCMDGTIPRGALPKALARIRELSEKYQLGCANVFHAGDGNLHPLILYDANKPGEMERAEAFGADILRCCVELGGVLTGEHGVGIEKRDLMPDMFTEIDLNQQQRVKCAFDSQGLLNPGKVFPTLHRCAELGRMHVHGGRLAFPDLPRF